MISRDGPPLHLECLAHHSFDARTSPSNPTEAFHKNPLSILPSSPSYQLHQAAPTCHEVINARLLLLHARCHAALRRHPPAYVLRHCHWRSLHILLLLLHLALCHLSL